MRVICELTKAKADKVAEYCDRKGIAYKTRKYEDKVYFDCDMDYEHRGEITEILREV